MRCMVMVKATEDSEAGVMPSAGRLSPQMGAFNEELVKAGVHAGGRGPAPQLEGRARAFLRAATARWSTGRSPRPRSWSPASGCGRCKSMEEAIEWVKRCPNPMPATARSRSARCSRPRISATRSRPKLREQEAAAARASDGAGSQPARTPSQAGLPVRARRSCCIGRMTGDRAHLDTHRTIEAVWRIESARLIAGLARMVRDVGLAEELAQDALVAALEPGPRRACRTIRAPG